MLKVIFIRHGATAGNVQKRYIGSTDEALCKEGVEKLQKLKDSSVYPVANLVFMSPMKRCRQTAEILYPSHTYHSVEDLSECDFGEFENKSYIDLQGNNEYEKWVKSGGTLPFPCGENMQEFKHRCVRAFLQVMKETEAKYENKDASIAFVVHGGTIMAIMECLGIPQKGYFEWQIGNAEGIVCEYEEERLKLCYQITF